MPFVLTLNKISAAVALSDLKVPPAEFVKGLLAKVRRAEKHVKHISGTPKEMFPECTGLISRFYLVKSPKDIFGR